MMFWLLCVVVEASADHAEFAAKTAELHTQAKRRTPSSLLDSTAPQLSPDDYAKMTLREMGFRGNINQKLKELEEKANHFLEKSIEGRKIAVFEKLQADPSLSSSLMEEGGPHQKRMLQAFENNLAKRGNLAEERTRQAMEALLTKTHELDKTTKEDEMEAHRIEAEMKEEADGAESTLSLNRNSLLETLPDSIDTQSKTMAHRTEERSIANRRDAGQSSFLQDDPNDSQEPDLEQEDSKMQELLADVKNTDRLFDTDTGPESFLERGFPGNEAQRQLDAAGPRLKELDQHFKHEIGQYADELQQDADSSLLQTGHEAIGSDGVHAPIGAPASDLAQDANFGAAPVAPEALLPSWLHAAPIDSTRSVSLRKA